MRFPDSLLCGAALAFALSACSGAKEAASTAGADVANAVSPIVGTWQIAGDTPAPKANVPQFVRLTFKTGGGLEASYVAAGGALAGVVHTPSKLKREHDRYVLGDRGSLRIVEGSRALEYTYDVKGGKLFLTSSGDTSATVYDKAS